MINLVAVVKDVTSLQRTDDAKSVTWALQLQIEKQMIQELKILHAQGLSNEEWWFLEACQGLSEPEWLQCFSMDGIASMKD